SGAFVSPPNSHREYTIVRRSDEADYLITALQIADLLPSFRRCLYFADIDWGVPIGGKPNAERHVTLPSIRTHWPAYRLATAVAVAKLAPVCPDSSWPVSLTLARPRQRRRWPGRHGRHVITKSQISRSPSCTSRCYRQLIAAPATLLLSSKVSAVSRLISF